MNLHCETDEFRFVKILWYFARLHRIHRTDNDEHHVEHLTQEKRRVLHFAFEYGLRALRVRGPRSGRLHPHPQDRACHLSRGKNNVTLTNC